MIENPDKTKKRSTPIRVPIGSREIEKRLQRKVIETSRAEASRNGEILWAKF